jgi:hypothetical protein
MCSLAVATHLDSPPWTATVQFCNVVCALMPRCLRPQAPLPLCHFGKQQNALSFLKAAPHSSLFSHCRCANGSSDLVQRELWQWWGRWRAVPYWQLGQMAKIFDNLGPFCVSFQIPYCSMQARYISSYQSIPGLLPLTQWFLWTTSVRNV